METIWWFLKKLKLELPYDPAIPLLRVYSKETKSVEEIPALPCPLFTIADMETTQVYTTCLMDQKMWHAYKMKKNEIL
jgi:hypothetical protein